MPVHVFFVPLHQVKQIAKGDKIMAKLKEEVTMTTKFTKFIIFTRYGKNEEVTAPRRMTTSEALHYFKALAVGGIE